MHDQVACSLFPVLLQPCSCRLLLPCSPERGCSCLACSTPRSSRLARRGEGSPGHLRQDSSWSVCAGTPTPAGVRPVWPGALIYDFLVSPQAPGATKAGHPAAGEGFGTLVPRKCVEQANNVCKSRLLLQVAAISWPLRGLVCRCFSQCLTCWHLALLHSSWGLGCLGGWSFRGLRME